MKGLKVLSLFDGISCGMVALERAGIPVERYVAYEIDKYAIQVSKKNYPHIEHCGDVTTADFTQYEGFDLLIGGSPCQGFSFAGKQLNFKDERSKLFFEFVRALEEVKPRYFLLENTPMKKEYENVISECLGVEPILINSALVSAQNRKRLYWTNISNLQQPKDKEILLEDIVEKDALVDREKSHAIIASIGRTTHREYFLKKQGQMVYSAIMLSNIYGGFKEKKPRVHLQKSVTIRAGQGGGHIPSLVIDDKVKEIPIDDFKKIIRKVTPLECERLQTLPDNYTDAEISNTQRYKCIGNGWTVDVIAHILRNLKEHTEKEREKMELIMNEVKIPEQITFNYEDIKREVQEKAKEYSITVYTSEQITEAKKDKATLNKLKKALNDERIRQERAYMQPFNDFKNKINELIQIIDEPVRLIDKQVKEYEENEKAEKKKKIEEYWESKEKPFEIPIEKVFEEKWLNKSVSMKSIEGAIDVFVESTEKDLETLAKLPEFAFEALEVYKTTLDINNALNEGRRLADIQKRKREHEAELARKKAEEREMVKGLDGTVYAQDGDKQGFTGCASEQLPGQIGFADAKSFEECMNPPVEEKQEEVKRQWVAFKANLTTEDAKALKAFFDSRNIEFKPI